MLDIRLAGENGLIIYFDEAISDKLLNEISFYTELLKQEYAEWLLDIIPSYTSIMLSYDLSRIDAETAQSNILKLIEDNTLIVNFNQTQVNEIPVFYDQQVGLDLQQLLEQKQLDLDSLIQLHTGRDYRVYAIGFSPCFAYLGQVDQALISPRLITPRLVTPAGSVGIADDQTAVYPITSPGGWNIIGRTPQDLSLSDINNLNYFKVGDTVRFRAIKQAEYLALGGTL